jgi:hypothetical protein
MKKLLLLTLCPFYLLAQFTDDFQSLENWIADTAHFEIDSLNQLLIIMPLNQAILKVLRTHTFL